MQDVLFLSPRSAPKDGGSASAGAVVGGDQVGHAGGEALGERDVEELVRAVRIRARTARARDEELRAGEALAEHGHERDGAAQAIEHGGPAEVAPRGVVHGLESHGWVAGASQPGDGVELSKRTLAPYGGSASRISVEPALAATASRVGGMRSESLSEVWGRSTLPPSAGAGSPAAPMMASAGVQVSGEEQATGSSCA